MHAGRLPAGAGRGHRIVGTADADGQADQGLRSGAIVGAEGAAADALLRRGASGRGVGVEPLPAAEAACPGAPFAGRRAGRRRFRLAGGRQLLGAARAGATAEKRGELATGREGDGLADAGIVARQQGQRRRDLALRQAEQGRHGAETGAGVEGGVEGARDGDLVAAEARRRGHRRLQEERHVVGAVAQAGAQEAGQVLRRQRVEGAGVAARRLQQRVVVAERARLERGQRRSGKPRLAVDHKLVGDAVADAQRQRAVRGLGEDAADRVRDAGAGRADAHPAAVLEAREGAGRHRDRTVDDAAVDDQGADRRRTGLEGEGAGRGGERRRY